MTPSPSPLPPWATYRIGRGETGVLTHQPYKSALLPLWRFKTVPIAQKSSSELWEAFLRYEKDGDFVGMDCTRKFLQMGMTRAKRYANHKGGRKYKEDIGGKKEGNKREMLPIVEGEWEGRKEKEEASMVFRRFWERARTYQPYLDMKAEFLREQKKWDKEQKAKEIRDVA